MRPHEWTRHAQCADLDDDLKDMFFSRSARGQIFAKSICARCSVIDECRDDVFAFEDTRPKDGKYGVFADLTAQERRDLVA